MERPILFSGAMVNAILTGRKTQTRRVVKDPILRIYQSDPTRVRADLDCPYGRPGERLWVRETWDERTVQGERIVFYRADCGADGDGLKWRPSIFMPREYSRINLAIISVRIQRVQDISEADIKAEGVERVRYRGYTKQTIDDPEDFSDLWDSINAKRGYPWKNNPLVWVIGFRRIQEAA